MEKIITKIPVENSLRNKYTFACTDETKAELEEIKSTLQVDVNEMLRHYVKRLIAQAKAMGTTSQDMNA